VRTRESQNPATAEQALDGIDVTIIVVNWNTRELLQQCLSSVVEWTRGSTYRLIVIDNGSVDGSAEMVRTDFPGVLLVANGENRGFSAATNQGLRRAEGRYALLLNSDTLLFEDSITSCVRFADGHPDVAVVGCRLVNTDRSFQSSAFRFPSLWTIFTRSSGLARCFPRSKLFNSERYGLEQWTEPRDCDVVMGSFFLVRRAVTDEVGLLDERFFMYGEETEWCRRMRDAGYRRVFYPATSVVHAHRGSSQGTSLRWWAQEAVQRSHVQYLRMSSGRLTASLAALMYAAGELARSAVCLARALFVGRVDAKLEAKARLQIAGAQLRLAACSPAAAAAGAASPAPVRNDAK
jgi:GT2 family glycosyltransferase